MERQQAFAERQHQQQYERQRQRYMVRPVPDQQRYDRDGYKDPYSRQVPDQQRYDRDGYKDIIIIIIITT